MPRFFNCGVGGYAVTMLRRDVQDFNAHWPCSSLPDAAITFVFEPRGDLVDILPYRISDKVDGPEALALCGDAQQYAYRKLLERAGKLWVKHGEHLCPLCLSYQTRFIPGSGGGWWGCANCHGEWK